MLCKREVSDKLASLFYLEGENGHTHVMSAYSVGDQPFFTLKQVKSAVPILLKENIEIEFCHGKVRCVELDPEPLVSEFELEFNEEVGKMGYKLLSDSCQWFEVWSVDFTDLYLQRFQRFQIYDFESILISARRKKSFFFFSGEKKLKWIFGSVTQRKGEQKDAESH